jgi:hypothetical protein
MWPSVHDGIGILKVDICRGRKTREPREPGEIALKH